MKSLFLECQKMIAVREFPDSGIHPLEEDSDSIIKEKINDPAKVGDVDWKCCIDIELANAGMYISGH